MFQLFIVRKTKDEREEGGEVPSKIIIICNFEVELSLIRCYYGSFDPLAFLGPSHYIYNLLMNNNNKKSGIC